jgi:hypothetical protein
MYRSFPQMWEGWTKNLALLFPNARGLAWRRAIEFAVVVVAAAFAVFAGLQDEKLAGVIAAAVTAQWLYLFGKRIRLAHFDWLSNMLAFFGLPLFAVLLLNSSICLKKGAVRWKGREYSGMRDVQPADEAGVAAGNK